MPRGQGSQGQGPSFPASLGCSDLGALIAALFRRASAAFLGELPFPWLKEPTFCLNYWGSHLLCNMNPGGLTQQRTSLPGERKLEPQTVIGLRSSAPLKYACKNNIHFQWNRFKCLGPMQLRVEYFSSLSFMLAFSNYSVRWTFSLQAHGSPSNAGLFSQGLPTDCRQLERMRTSIHFIKPLLFKLDVYL